MTSTPSTSVNAEYDIVFAGGMFLYPFRQSFTVSDISIQVAQLPALLLDVSLQQIHL